MSDMTPVETRNMTARQLMAAAAEATLRGDADAVDTAQAALSALKDDQARKPHRTPAMAMVKAGVVQPAEILPC